MNTTTFDIHMQLLDLLESLEPLPAAVAQLAAIVVDEDSGVNDAASVLRDDPFLVAALLREANSAMSSPVDEIVTIEMAVGRLGLARILAVATAAGLGTQGRGALESYDVEAGVLWDLQVRASYIAEAIYRQVPSASNPGVVTAALLHDMGQVVLDRFLDPKFVQLARLDGLSIIEIESELAAVDHAELGAILLDAWGIPPSITEAVRCHHEPDGHVGPDAYIVCLATLLAAETRDAELEHSDPDAQLRAEAAEALGVDPEDILRRAGVLLERAGLPVASTDDD